MCGGVGVPCFVFVYMLSMPWLLLYLWLLPVDGMVLVSHRAHWVGVLGCILRLVLIMLACFLSSFDVCDHIDFG